jgi:hypothetical protein
METILKIIRVIIWWLIFDTAATAGRTQSLFLLGIAIGAMTYWYWRYPVFRKNPEERED